MKGPVVAIVGRPNVGKSALFNRLVGRRQAIVSDRPGVTRDRIYAPCEWAGSHFVLVDTGGMDPDDPDVLRRQVFQQAEAALEEADLLLFVVDGQTGIHPLDEDVAEILRARSKPVVLVVNKAENPEIESDSYEFYRLGVGDPIAVSAIHGSNTGDLMDLVVERIGGSIEEDEQEEARITLLGRPNVGKSSLLNRILGQERSLVHPEAGTTRDTVDTLLDFDGRPIRLVDTAGIRRKGKVSDEVEYFSSVRALSALRRAQVGILVLDAQDGVVSQDKRVAGEILEAGLATVVLVNKWDLVARMGSPAQLQRWRKDFAAILAEQLDFVSWAPVLYVSAKSGERTEEILPACLEVLGEWSRRVDTPVLNRLVQDAVAMRPPPSFKGQHLKVFYASQKKSRPPTFVLKVNSPKLVHFSYRRYLENQLREAFGFVGTPIKLVFER
ncbi:MAG: ribosome biogenesis GTPase Der [Armatimonadetes bacterium]|nr:ribosome biogenesis GTPase Der [Armatimonadota bacterium]